VTTPQVLDNLSVVHGSHVFRMGLNFRFYRHVDQRGQPGGINVTPSVTFSATTRPAFLGATGNSGFALAPGINSTDQTLLGSLINNVYGLPASMNQVFISNLKDNAFLPFKIGDEVTLYAEKHNLDQYNFFFQDEWKIRNNLTLNYGARWEINPPANTSPQDNVFVAATPIAGNARRQPARRSQFRSREPLVRRGFQVGHRTTLRPGVQSGFQIRVHAHSLRRQRPERHSSRLWNRV
jgi:outer membrane receptor protein involved in Fe transport